jgi:hypothetical protein
MQESCTECPVSTFAEDTRSFECTNCPIGYSTYGKTESSDCTACATGEYWFGGFCLECETGKKRSEKDDPTACKFCEPGRVVNQKGAVSCLMCLPGKYQDVAGQQSCIKCAKETYRPEEDEFLALPPVEWTLEITSQDITESVGVTVSQNEWTLAFSSQNIAHSAGVVVMQGSVTGTLKKELNGASTSSIITAAAGVTFDTSADIIIGDIEWTLAITSQEITESANVVVTQGSGADLVTGTLKTALVGDTTSVVISAAVGVVFIETVDIVVGSVTIAFASITTCSQTKDVTTIPFANINTVTNDVSATGTLKMALIGSSTSLVITSAADVTFVVSADLVIGSTTVFLANLNTAAKAAATTETSLQKEWTLAIASQDITESVDATVTQGTITGTLKKELSGPTTAIVIITESGEAFVTTTDILVGSTTVAFANINTATDTTKVIEAKIVRLPASSCFDCAIGQTTNGGTGGSSCNLCGVGRYGIGCKLCEIGTYGELTTNAPLSCSTCPSGWKQESQGAGSCQMCLPGKYQNLAGQSSCKKCLKERFRPEEKDILYFTLDIASQAITESADVAISQNEWILDITSQDITESLGVTVSQNEWTLDFSVQDITKDAGVTVTQGTTTGILKTALTGAGMTSVVITTSSVVAFNTAADIIIGNDVEWTLTIVSEYITESEGAVITQGSGAELVTGKLKTALTGDTTTVVIETDRKFTFVATADIIIGSTTVALASITTSSQTKSATTITSASINTATHSISSMGTLQAALTGATTNIVVTGAVGGTFVSSSEVVIGSDEWTLAITAQTMTESAGTLVTQGFVAGTLKTTLFASECTLAVLNAPVITETSGVTVTQGTYSGTLKTTLSGGATSIVIETASGVTFLDNVDITVGTTTLIHANINSATNTVVIGSVVIETKPGIIFHDNADIVIGTGVTILSENIASATKSKSAAIVAFTNVNTATNSVSNVGTLKTALTGTTTSVVVAAVGDINFVTTTNLIIGSSTVVLANINAATESRPARLSASSCFDCPIGQTTNGGKGASLCNVCGAGKYGTGCQVSV